MATEVFQIDTKDTCLLCFTKCYFGHSSNLGPGGGLSAIKQISSSTAFRMLLRYLKIDIAKLDQFSSYFRRFDDDVDGLGMLVSLCDQCSSVATQFLQLFQEFENIRMQLDKCCREMHDLIEDGGKDYNRVLEYRKLIDKKKSVDQLNASIAETLRKETLEKCALKMKFTTPKVKLKQVASPPSPLKPQVEVKYRPGPASKKFKEMPQLISMAQSRKPGPASKTNQPRFLPPEPRPSPQAPIKTPTSSMIHRVSTTTTTPPTSSSSIRASPTVSSRVLRCHFCGKIFQNQVTLSEHQREIHLQKATATTDHLLCIHCQTKFSSTSNLNTHLISKHSFETLRDQLPPSTTREALDNSVEMILARRKKRPDKKNPVGCPLCDKVFPHPVFLRTHSLRSHINVIIKNLGSKLTITNVRRQKPAPVPVPTQFKCSHCGKIFKNKEILIHHFRDTHLNEEKPKPPPTTASSSNLPKCNYCGKKFTQPCNLNTHHMHVHPLETFQESLPPGTTEDDFRAAVEVVLEGRIRYPAGAKAVFGCSLCLKRCRDKFDLKTHTLQVHFPTVLVNLQVGNTSNNTSVETFLQGQLFPDEFYYDNQNNGEEYMDDGEDFDGESRPLIVATTSYAGDWNGNGGYVEGEVGENDDEVQYEGQEQWPGVEVEMQMDEDEGNHEESFIDQILPDPLIE